MFHDVSVFQAPRDPESAGTKTTGLVNMPGPNRNLSNTSRMQKDLLRLTILDD